MPLAIVWGMADPVSGPDMVAYLREHAPNIAVTELPEISHYPHLEVPNTVASELLKRDA